MALERTDSISTFGKRDQIQSTELQPGINEEAQSKLRNGSVLIVGIKSAGAIAAQHLVQARLGRIILVDEDARALAVLRKKLVEAPKLESEISCHAWKPDGHDAEAVLGKSDVVIEGLSNWQNKLLIGDVCMQLGIPLVHAGGNGYRYQLFTMCPRRSACLRCAFPLAGIDDVPLVDEEPNSISPVLAMVGAWQALEAIKLIAKIGAIQGNELTKFDWLSGEFETIRGLDPRKDCPDCGRASRS